MDSEDSAQFYVVDVDVDVDHVLQQEGKLFLQ